MTMTQIMNLAEYVRLYGDAGSNIRVKLALAFLAYLGVKPEDLTVKPRARWEHLHRVILDYGKENKLSAIRYLRTQGEYECKFKIDLKYAKDYVEWVLGYPDTYEPKFDEVPF